MPEPHAPGATSPTIGDLSPDRRFYWDGDIWGWLPLWLTPDEVIAAAYQCFGRTGADAAFLASGLLNQSWRVLTNDGAFVLRVGRSERTVEQVAHEHAFVRRLHADVPMVVPPLPGRDGSTIQRWRGRTLSLFPFVAGQVGSSMPPDERNRQVAATLAQLHRASLEHIHIRLGQRAGFHSVDEHPRWVWTEVKPVLARDRAGTDGFVELVAALDRETAELDAWLDGLHASKRPLKRATVHGDFNPRNLIFQDAQLVAVVDWDECRVEPLAWEVAQAGFGAVDVDPPAFWRTYLDAGGPLAREDFELLPGFARMGALSELHYAVKDGHATPHAMRLLREVVAAVEWLKTR